MSPSLTRPPWAPRPPPNELFKVCYHLKIRKFVSRLLVKYILLCFSISSDVVTVSTFLVKINLKKAFSTELDSDGKRHSSLSIKICKSLLFLSSLLVHLNQPYSPTCYRAHWFYRGPMGSCFKFLSSTTSHQKTRVGSTVQQKFWLLVRERFCILLPRNSLQAAPSLELGKAVCEEIKSCPLNTLRMLCFLKGCFDFNWLFQVYCPI